MYLFVNYIYKYYSYNSNRLLNETSDSTTYIDIEKGEKPIKNRTSNKFTSQSSLIEMNTIRSNVFKVITNYS